MKKLNLRKSGSRSVRVPAFGRLGTRSISLGTAILLIFSLLLTPSLAWFSMTRANTPANMVPGKLGNMTLQMAVVPHTTGEGATEATEKNRVYKTFTSDNWLGMKEPPANGEVYTISISDLDFGKIDNLSRLKPENIIYLKLTIPKKNGAYVNFKLYNRTDAEGYFFDIYNALRDTNGNLTGGYEKLVPEDIAEGTLPTLESHRDRYIMEGFRNIQKYTDDESTPNVDESLNPVTYLHYSYLFSTENLEPMAFSTLVFDTEYDPKQNADVEVTEPFSANSDSPVISEVCPDEVYDKAEENYYLYIKITPDLNTFAYSIEYLNTIMPCYVLFHIGAEFEVLPIDPNATPTPEVTSTPETDPAA